MPLIRSFRYNVESTKNGVIPVFIMAIKYRNNRRESATPGIGGIISFTLKTQFIQSQSLSGEAGQRASNHRDSRKNNHNNARQQLRMTFDKTALRNHQQTSCR